MNKYLAVEWSSHPINVVEIERETDSSVWIKGRRQAKINESGGYFDTYAEAKERLLFMAQQRVDSASGTLDYYKSKLDNIKGLKEIV